MFYHFQLKLSDDLILNVRTLSEEEEKTFLDKAIENMKNRRNHFNQKKGHHGNRKRRSGGHDRNDEKKSKSDEWTAAAAGGVA